MDGNSSDATNHESAKVGYVIRNDFGQRPIVVRLYHWIELLATHKLEVIKDHRFWRDFVAGAADAGCYPPLKEILLKGVSPTPPHWYPIDPLSSACEKGIYKNVRLLLRHKANPNAESERSDAQGDTLRIRPLFWLLSRAWNNGDKKILSANRYDIARSLLKRGADPSCIITIYLAHSRPLQWAVSDYVKENFSTRDNYAPQLLQDLSKNSFQERASSSLC